MQQNALCMRVVEKPWGHEVVFAETEFYAGKVITINANCRLSLQYHQHKDESIYVLEGTLYLEVGESEESLLTTAFTVGQGFRVRPGELHRMRAGDALVRFAEVSTPHLTDVVRIADDYGREGTSSA